MNKAIIKKTEALKGQVSAPASKAYMQRMVIAAALSHGASKISEPLLSEDTEATLRAVKAIGAEVETTEKYWTVEGPSQFRRAESVIDCGESGATLRFMIPVAALLPGQSTFILGKTLKKRPIQPLLHSLKNLGVETNAQNLSDQGTIIVNGGGILGGKTSMPGDVSSQFVSGLMFACPLAQNETEIVLTTPLESKDYVRMTKEVISQHNIKVIMPEKTDQIRIPGNQTYKSHNHRVPGDFSSAAFLLAAAALTRARVKVRNLDQTTNQGDKAILEILRQMGANVKIGSNTIEVKGTGEPLDPIDLDAREIPDLVPVCTVLGCYAKGSSKIYGAYRLRYKESDRLASMHLELKKMGAKIIMDKESLTVKGPCELHGAIIDPHNDHRIAMACTVAALGAEGSTQIDNPECVRKSYPRFFDDLRKLGAEVIGWKFDR